MQMTTLIGSGVAGFLDGIGTAANIQTVSNVCIDNTHNYLYIVCTTKVKKVDLSTATMTDLSK